MTALHFRVRLVGARLCHLLAQFPLFQIQFPSPLPLFRSKLWAKRVHLIYTAVSPPHAHLSGHSPKWRQSPTTVCVFVCVSVCACTPEMTWDICRCVLNLLSSQRHCPSFLNYHGLLIEGKQQYSAFSLWPCAWVFVCTSDNSGRSHTLCLFDFLMHSMYLWQQYDSTYTVWMIYWGLHHKSNSIFCLILYV